MSTGAPFGLPDITPFATFSLLKLQEPDLSRAEARIAQLVRDQAFALEDILAIDTTQPAVRYRLPDAPPPPAGGDTGPWVTWYVERRRPAWLVPPGGSRKAEPDDAVVDEVNQLVVVLAHRGYLGVYASDDGARAEVERSLLAVEEGKAIQRVEARSLHNAFANNPAVTLWLRGLHRPTDLKASRKTLFGSRLRRALNPLEDQTYHYSAARCLPSGGQAIGIAPSRARVWLRSVQGMEQLVQLFQWVVDEVVKTSASGAAESEDNLLEVLASPAGDVSGLSGASELSIFPPDPAESSDDGDERSEALRDNHVRWAERGSFEVTPSPPAAAGDGTAVGGSPDFTLLARLGDEEIAELTVQVEATAAGSLRLRVDESRRIGSRAEADAIARVLRLPDAAVVWYDSGHTLSGGQVFETRHRDLRFRGWRWASLEDAIITAEKPVKPSTAPAGSRKGGKPTMVFAPELVGVGARTSLFDWVAEGGQAGVLVTHGGWLLCDDGSLEVSDFVHLETTADGPRLTLIHVKGAKSASPTRKIAVTDYELVVAQALKNLRWLDPQHLARRLGERAGSAIGTLVWENGTRAAPADAKRVRREFLGQLTKLRRLQRRVVVLQPSLRKDRYLDGVAEFDAGKARPSSDLIRLYHLDHLFLGLESACHAYGADLFVLGQDASAAGGTPGKASRRKPTR